MHAHSGQFHVLKGFQPFNFFVRQDETGEEGVIILPDDGSKQVRIGGKVETAKVRQSEHESTSQMAAAFERQAEVATVSAVDQAGTTGSAAGERPVCGADQIAQVQHM